MKYRAGLWAGAVLCLLAATATSAAPVAKKPVAPVITPAERCDALEKRFDEALPQHQDAKNLIAAKKLRAEGELRCKAGKHAAGALFLARALTDIGVDVEDK